MREKKQEKKERNLLMYKMRKEKGLSYRQLSKFFNLNVNAVFDIIKRYEKKEKAEKR